jgi:uncharacterized protein YjbJ (UPF0337 family)
MKWEQIQAQWKDFAGSARAHRSQLTDDDFEALNGTKGHLVGRIQKRYKITRGEAEKQAGEWSDGLLDIVQASRTR